MGRIITNLCYNRSMKKFTTSSKLYALLFVMLAGLVAISTLLFTNQEKMKRELDTLYFGSLVPISNLKELHIIFERDIVLLLYKDLHAQNDAFYQTQTLKRAKERISKIWKEYAKSYKNAGERPFIDAVNNELKKLYIYLDAIILALPQNSAKIDYENLNEVAKHISDLMKQVINYEVKVAAYERQQLLQTYRQSTLYLNVTIITITLLSILFFIIVMRSIKRNERRLTKLKNELEHANNELHHASITDGLSKLYNRRYFDQIIENEIKRAQREKRTFTFMMMDIDHFKKYNDTYGHQAGDKVIQSVADAIKKVYRRPTDMAFRLGGEEFGVILTHTQQKDALDLAQKLLDAIKQLQIEHTSSDTTHYVTISIGMIIYNTIDLDCTQLYSDVDKMLYLAKEEGRNRVVSEVV